MEACNYNPDATAEDGSCEYDCATWLDTSELYGCYWYAITYGYDTEFLEDVYTAVIVINLFLFLLLCSLGYFLINKTIKPLKTILLELKEHKNKKDLSQRLKKQNTNDELKN